MEEGKEEQTRPDVDEGGRRRPEAAGERLKRLEKDGEGRKGWRKPEGTGEGRRRQENTGEG